MIIMLKITIALIVLALITPFMGMLLAIVGGASVAPSTTKKEKILAGIIIAGSILLVYVGVPVLIFIL